MEEYPTDGIIKTINAWLSCRDQIENKELRDLLAINKNSVKTASEDMNQPATVAQEQSPQTESDEWPTFSVNYERGVLQGPGDRVDDLFTCVHHVFVFFFLTQVGMQSDHSISFVVKAT